MLLVLLMACNATCRQACAQIESCSEVDHSGQIEAECREACLVQEDLYENVWEDEALVEAFDAQRNCIRDSSCAQIEDGECYDPELWAW